MEQIKDWYLRNYAAITWFIIGFLVCSGLTEMGRGEYFSAMVSFIFAALNYGFVKK